MRHAFKHVVAAGLVALSLGGCAQFQKLSDALNFVSTASAAVGDVSVSPEAVLVASNLFDAVEVSATNYLRLKRCTGANGPLCRDPAITKTLISAIKTARVARDDLQDFLRQNQQGNVGLYVALKQSISTIQAMIAAYTSAAGDKQ